VVARDAAPDNRGKVKPGIIMIPFRLDTVTTMPMLS
jgi:hypothetical protein